jgi:hypothetical protein
VFGWKLRWKEQKANNINFFFCHAYHLLVTCCYAQMCKEVSDSSQTISCPVISLDIDCSDVVQSAFSCSNQVLSTINHKAAMGCSFVHSSSFSKQLQQLPSGQELLPMAAEQNLAKKYARRPSR